MGARLWYKGMVDLSGVERAVAELDAVYRPVATMPVDLDMLPDLGAHTAAALAELGVDERAEAVLRDLVELYAAGEPDVRAAIRRLFDRYTSFRWAARLPRGEEVTEAGLRAELILFSARDQGSDPRDEVLGLRDLCARARRAGLDADPLLAEAAGLSSDVDRYGMGSTRTILLGHLGR
ncbi:hypothetical protein QEZ54_10385 [Catellatospora sp. KI3]|uniref:hypothetical protein n=1 Tax=Catellatospora sp. KI3 TaxID=3041620 RepID=UPI0024825B62|nr:hypothetical protein [Catellatospora sp. KI3]MDI1461376.1 hypothetical protein [Catellatospora sp. KI3]